MEQVMEMMVTSFQRPQVHTSALGAPDPVAGHC